ncbi:MAG: hypothetical protein IPM79_26130 [Polyangiaceae bacterium]|nr:hypothetical protein [Polyangiaceae bacterium]
MQLGHSGSSTESAGCTAPVVLIFTSTSLTVSGFLSSPQPVIFPRKSGIVPA